MSHKKIVVNMGDVYVKLAEIIVNKMSSEDKDARLISLLSGHYYEFDSAFEIDLEKAGLSEKDLIKLLG